MSNRELGRDDADRARSVDIAEIQALIDALASDDGFKRQKARWALVEVGNQAVTGLVRALASPNEHVRWEVAKALKDIGDPASAPALVDALEDASFGVRWLAADGLIVLGHAGLKPLLNALTQRSDSPWLREGAHHVLRVLADLGLWQEVAPVLDALQDVEPAASVPWAAQKAMEGLSGSEGGLDTR